MKVTIDKEHSEKIGLEVTDVSVVFDSQRDVLTVYGMMFSSPSFRVNNDSVEPGILCSFLDEKGRIIYAHRARDYMPFSPNRYSLFASEVTSAADHFDVGNVSEIRLLPFLSAQSAD